MYLAESNNLLLIKARLIKKIKTVKEVFNIVVNKNKVEGKIPLQQVSTPLLKKRKKTSLIFNTFSVKEKAITLANIPKKRAKKQVLVLTTSMLVTTAKKKAARNAGPSKTSKTSETGENGQNDKNDKNSKYKEKSENSRTNFA